MNEIPPLDKDWVHYLTRPFSLLGASIWHSWYASAEFKNLFSLPEPDALMVEEPRGIVRHYRSKTQLDHYWEAGRKLVLQNPDYCAGLLLEGIRLNARAELYLSGKDNFPSFPAAIDFLKVLFIKATLLPYLVLKVLDESGNVNDKELDFLSKKLRSSSYYHAFIDQVIVPFSIEGISPQNLPNSAEVVSMLTLSEIFSQQWDKVEERIHQQKEGKHFIYQVINGKEKVDWTANVASITSSIEKENFCNEINGQIAYPGIVKGIARVVLSLNSSRIFNPGDILVTINSNPDLLPIIKKASAIVTDEGGITCHAAIISRELKIPCIIGTKNATKVLKDGMMVEIDAEQGVVRIIS